MNCNPKKYREHYEEKICEAYNHTDKGKHNNQIDENLHNYEMTHIRAQNGTYL